VAESFNALKISRHTVKDFKDPSPKEKACKGQKEPHPSSGLRATVETVFEGPDARFL